MDKTEKLMTLIPKDGFIKLHRDRTPELSSAQKTALNRKGNILFNSGEIEKAKKIFITTGYTDGMVRVGDFYLEKKRPLDALQLYKLAPAPDRVESIIFKMVKVVKNWIKEA